jgi:hypothetical protein
MFVIHLPVARFNGQVQNLKKVSHRRKKTDALVFAYAKKIREVELFSKMAKFDLTTRNLQFLDRHLTFPLLEFLLSKDVSTGRVNFSRFHEKYGFFFNLT